MDQLCTVLSANVEFACSYIAAHFKGVSVQKPQGTYMLFIDCAEWLREHNMSIDQLVKAGCEVGVAWQHGRAHGGTEHIRINLALPEALVQEAFERLNTYVFNA